MKRLLLATVALSAIGVAPALSCAMMQQTAASGAAPGQTAQSAGMMCSAPAAVQAQPQMSQPGQQAQSSGGCPCCRNMAMMQPQPGQQGGSSMPGMGDMPGVGNMPGMQHGTPPAPEQPKP